jgi:AcrR family transcriptional regulator
VILKEVVMDESPADGSLRARRRAQTENEVEDAALAAFGSTGFEGTTMEQIAASAGISVRTAFRYFPAKVDTVLISARSINRLLGAGLAARIHGGASLVEVEDAITAALSALVASDPAVVAKLKRLRALMLTDDRLRAEVAKSEGYLAGLSGTEGEPMTPSLEARLIAELASATLRSAFDSWAGTTDDSVRLLEHYRRARDVRDAVVARRR